MSPVRLFRPRPKPRQRPTSPDPVAVAVAAAVAAGPLTPSQDDDPAPDPAELVDYIDVADSADGPEGTDTLVTFADELHSYCDPYDSGLEQILADQPGIEHVLAEDREVVYLRSRLSLADVTAAVVTAVCEANRNPRPPQPVPGEVTDEDARALADQVADLLAEHGFVRHTGDPGRTQYWHRAGGDGFVQVVSIHRGLGRLTNGTDLTRLVHVWHGVHIPELAGPLQRLPADLDQMAPAAATLLADTHANPTPAGLTAQLHSRVLPWLEGTRDRATLAAWLAEDPERVFPPAQRPRHALALAGWGYVDAADAMLRHLDRKWRSLARDRDAVEARRLVQEQRDAPG